MIKYNYRLFCSCLLAMFTFCQSMMAQTDLIEQYGKALELFSNASSTSEYMEAYNAFQELKDLMPDEVDIHYRMGICAEIIAEEDEMMYDNAYHHYKDYWALCEEYFDEEAKMELREKIEDVEYALAIVSKRQLTDYWMNGEWYFKLASGKTDDDYDIRISCKNGRYYVDFKSSVVQSNYWEVLSEEWKRVEMERSGNTFSFNTEFNNTVVENPGTRKQFEQFKYSCRFHYDLELKDGELVGTRTQTYYYSLMGNNRFRTCEEAVARGRGRVDAACSGNCGSNSVYFRKVKSGNPGGNGPFSAERLMKRAEIALRLAQTPQDFQFAAREYKEVKEVQPDDPYILFCIGVCYEMAIPGDAYCYYDASHAYSDAEKLLAEGQNPELLEEVRKRKDILERNRAAAIQKDKNTISPSSLCHNWVYHDASGKTEQLFNFSISESHGVYSVHYDAHESEGGSVSPHWYRAVEVKQEGNTIKFSVVHNRSRFNGNRETYWFKQAMSYELVLLDGQLRGVAHITDIVEAYGNSDYSTVSRAMRDGEGTVIQDKHGDCGTIEVYFTK